MTKQSMEMYKPENTTLSPKPFYHTQGLPIPSQPYRTTDKEQYISPIKKGKHKTKKKKKKKRGK